MKGFCLCGAITVLAPDHTQIDVCHCSMCRRWGGGPMFAMHCGAEVSFEGAKPSTYRSSDWAERGFCPTCGTHLFYHLIENDEYILPAGLFEEDAGFEIKSQIFIDFKPGYYALANETPTMTGEEVFAQFSEGEE